MDPPAPQEREKKRGTKRREKGNRRQTLSQKFGQILYMENFGKAGAKTKAKNKKRLKKAENKSKK